MKSKLHLFSFVVLSTLTTQCFAQSYVQSGTYTPQSGVYNSVPQYSSAPQYNSVPQQYGTIPQYNSAPQYGSVPQQYGTYPQGTIVPNQINGQIVNGQIVNGRIVNRQPSQTPNTIPNYGVANAVLPGNQANIKPAWYQTLVKDREHNFGVVARASKQEHTFEFENTTGSDLFLTNVKASCGCTKPRIITSHVKPGEKAKILTAYDTLNFYGPRGATVTVSVQKAGKYVEYGEVQLAVKGFIRRDVVLNPGEFTFKDVNLKETAQRTASVLYAGNPQWKILEVKSTNPHLNVDVRELVRNASGQVNYEFVVKLDGDQPAGPFNETLTIVTNDKKTTGMPIKVTGNVKQRIQVSPIQLGVVNKGQKIKKKLILNSEKAIAVTDIKTNDPRIKFQLDKGEKSLHILTYELDTSEPGQIDDVITIVTSDPGQPETKVPFSVQIVPATIAGNVN